MGQNESVAEWKKKIIGFTPISIFQVAYYLITARGFRVTKNIHSQTDGVGMETAGSRYPITAHCKLVSTLCCRSAQILESNATESGMVSPLSFIFHCFFKIPLLFIAVSLNCSCLLLQWWVLIPHLTLSGELRVRPTNSLFLSIYIHCHMTLMAFGRLFSP